MVLPLRLRPRRRHSGPRSGSDRRGLHNGESRSLPARGADRTRLPAQRHPHEWKFGGHGTYKNYEIHQQAGGWREIARYPYIDRDGSLLFEVVRYLKPDGTKTFIQVRPSGVEAAGTTDPERTGGVQAGGIVVGLEAGKYLPDTGRRAQPGRPPGSGRRTIPTTTARNIVSAIARAFLTGSRSC